jgi:hypothetical protein
MTVQVNDTFLIHQLQLQTMTRSRIHERTISLRFLGIILRILRFEVSVYNVYIANQLQYTFAQGGRRSKIR